MKLNGKVALVTGGGKGIGAATVIELAKEGCHVAINYFTSKEQALVLKDQVEKKYGVRILLIKADITSEEQVKKMVDEVIETFGRIDVLVNNAAYSSDNYLEDKTTVEFKMVMNVNILGTFLVTRQVGKMMLENKKGKIINIASTNGIDTNNPISIDYDASKAGVISLTHNFALQYAPYIHVNAVAPGWTNTEAVLEMNPEIIKEESQNNLLKRFAEPEEIAKVVVFLASDDSSYINNEVIRVDGGCC